MIVAYVRHYINNDGILFFPEWFTNISSVLENQEGFISIGYGQDKKDESCMNLLLEFENEEKLTEWAKSDLHNLEVSKLDPYRTKSYEVTRINFINYIGKKSPTKI